MPNWDNDEECLAVTLDFLDSLGLTNAEADTFDSQVDIPGVECFTTEAWNYDDGGVCSETWISFDAWCGADASDAVKDLCNTVNVDYYNCVNGHGCESSLDEDTLDEDTIGVSPPGEDCYYEAAFMYSDESACT